MSAAKKKGKKAKGSKAVAKSDSIAEELSTLAITESAHKLDEYKGEYVNVQVIYSEHTVIEPFMARLPADMPLTSELVDETLKLQTILELKKTGLNTKVGAASVMANVYDQDVDDLGKMNVRRFLEEGGNFLVSFSSDNKEDGPPVFIDAYRKLAKSTALCSELLKLNTKLAKQVKELKAGSVDSGSPSAESKADVSVAELQEQVQDKDHRIRELSQELVDLRKAHALEITQLKSNIKAMERALDKEDS